MNKKDDFYEILGVDYFVRDDELRKAYLSKIKLYHPDRFKGSKSFAQDMTAKINIAYDTLKDYDKRKRYDYDNGIVEKRNEILYYKQRDAENRRKEQQKLAKQKEKEKIKLEKEKLKKQKNKQKEELKTEKLKKKEEEKRKKSQKKQNNKPEQSNFQKQEPVDEPAKNNKNIEDYPEPYDIFQVFFEKKLTREKLKKEEKENQSKNDVQKNDVKTKEEKPKLTDEKKRERRITLIERIVLDSIIIGLIITVILLIIFQ